MECVVQGIIETQFVKFLFLDDIITRPDANVKIQTNADFCVRLSVLAVFYLTIETIPMSVAITHRTVRHVGGAMRGAGAEQISVLVRTVAESKVSKNVLRFFYALGYKLDHELLRVGFAFHFQRGAQITITVTSANKMLKLHATEEAVPVTPGIQLVEVTAPAPAAADNYKEVVSSVTSFCEYLAPLLHLSKPGVSTGIVPTAAAAAASLMSNGGGKTL
ncbi:hypothetical protein ACLOJK_041516 [Asimina triloba]